MTLGVSMVSKISVVSGVSKASGGFWWLFVASRVSVASGVSVVSLASMFSKASGQLCGGRPGRVSPPIQPWGWWPLVLEALLGLSSVPQLMVTRCPSLAAAAQALRLHRQQSPQQEDPEAAGQEGGARAGQAGG